MNKKATTLKLNKDNEITLFKMHFPKKIKTRNGGL
jgi:hypothetical protein